jgi:hypothetical protein
MTLGNFWLPTNLAQALFSLQRLGPLPGTIRDLIVVTSRSRTRTEDGPVRSLYFWTGVFVLTGAGARVAAEPPSDARAAINRFYADRLKQPFIQFPGRPEVVPAPPPWIEPIKQLASENEETRATASAYLKHLLALTLEDEHSGKAPWRNTPYWGGGADVPARDLRKEVAQELAKSKPTPEMLPLLRWYLDHEPHDSFLPPVVEVLGKVDGEAAYALRAELVTKPHANAAVVAAAIQQITARKKSIPAETLLGLYHHYRAEIRGAARALNTQQGGKDPGAFDPARAIRSQPVVKLMDRVLGLMPDLPAAKAQFVTITVRYLDEKKAERAKDVTHGWLAKKEKDEVVIYTPHGRVCSFHDHEKTEISETEKVEGGVRFKPVNVVTELTVTLTDPSELVKAVVESRKSGKARVELSERGGLTGQFRGSGATLFEANFGAWLYRAGKDSDAAQILLPALDSLDRDEHFVLMVREQIGEIVGQKMLVAFVGDRDYTSALASAKQINALYPNTRFHRYAQRLAEQLPRRSDDFTKLKLPTPQEWAKLKKTLTRDQQMDFLCERMRLMNCFQMGQPGGYNPGETQYAEPRGLSENAAWGGNGGKTKLINPLTELVGSRSWRDDEPKLKGLELTVKDIPRLSKYLREDWYMLIVSFWRDFSPERDLSSTRSEFASIINDLARKDICRIRDWAAKTPAEIDKQIDRINQWAIANANKTRKQLEWDALEEDIASGEPWRRLEDRVEALLKLQEPRIYDLMQRTLAKADTATDTREHILDLYRKYDVKRAKELALTYLADADADATLRLSAALIVFETGDKSKARPILGTAVEDGYGWRAAAEALLADNTPESRMELRRLTRNGRLSEDRDHDRAKLLARCAAIGLKEPYAYYLKLLQMDGKRLPILDKDGKELNAINFGESVAEIFAAEIVSGFAAGDTTVKDIATRYPAARNQIPHLKKWLQSRLEAKD